MTFGRLILIVFCVSLSACSMQQGDFPSLAKRPFEDGLKEEKKPAPPVVVVAALPAPVQVAVDEAVSRSSAAHAKFLKNLPSVQRRANSARGSAISSESWVAAQMDLAALEMMRGPSVTALADIDALYFAQLNSEIESGSPGNSGLIAKRRDQISAQVKNQQDAIEAMKAKLR